LVNSAVVRQFRINFWSMMTSTMIRGNAAKMIQDIVSDVEVFLDIYGRERKKAEERLRTHPVVTGSKIVGSRYTLQKCHI